MTLHLPLLEGTCEAGGHRKTTRALQSAQSRPWLQFHLNQSFIDRRILRKCSWDGSSVAKSTTAVQCLYGCWWACTVPSFMACFNDPSFINKSKQIKSRSKMHDLSVSVKAFLRWTWSTQLMEAFGSGTEVCATLHPKGWHDFATFVPEAI